MESAIIQQRTPEKNSCCINYLIRKQFMRTKDRRVRANDDGLRSLCLSLTFETLAARARTSSMSWSVRIVGFVSMCVYVRSIIMNGRAAYIIYYNI